MTQPPADPGGMSTPVKVVLGAAIGLSAGFVLWFLAAFTFGRTEDQTKFLLLSALAPLLVPAPLLIWPATRPWAGGLLIGTAISSIGLSSLCSAVLSGI